MRQAVPPSSQTNPKGLRARPLGFTRLTSWAQAGVLRYFMLQ